MYISIQWKWFLPSCQTIWIHINMETKRSCQLAASVFFKNKKILLEIKETSSLLYWSKGRPLYLHCLSSTILHSWSTTVLHFSSFTVVHIWSLTFNNVVSWFTFKKTAKISKTCLLLLSNVMKKKITTFETIVLVWFWFFLGLALVYIFSKGSQLDKVE